MYELLPFLKKVSRFFSFVWLKIEKSQLNFKDNQPFWKSRAACFINFGGSAHYNMEMCCGKVSFKIAPYYLYHCSFCKPDKFAYDSVVQSLAVPASVNKIVS